MKQIIVCGVAALGLSGAFAQEESSVPVYTDVFRPFIGPADASRLPAAKLVDMVLTNAGIEGHLTYEDFAFGLHRVRSGTEALSFPWRRTEERERGLVFSNPIMELTNRYHYNIRFFPKGIRSDDLGQYRIGRVASYQFTTAFAQPLAEAEAADQIEDYSTERQAIAGLLGGEIDFLPLPARVVAATLTTDFPNEFRLIRPVDGLRDTYALHMVAPDTAWGRDTITAFDRSLANLQDADVVTTDYALGRKQLERRGDVAVLEAAEGFPVVIGTDLSAPEHQYAVPGGTRVLVLDWSDRIAEPTSSDQIYETMTDETNVLILNGPHLGKEISVKNMHITLAE